MDAGGVGRLGGHAAHVGAALDAHEAGLAPATAPGVGQRPELGVGRGAVADQKKSVVQTVRAAAGVRVDTGRVQLATEWGQIPDWR